MTIESNKYTHKTENRWKVKISELAYMPYIILWDKISQNFAHLEGSSHKRKSDLAEFSNHITTDFMKK